MLAAIRRAGPRDATAHASRTRAPELLRTVLGEHFHGGIEQGSQLRGRYQFGHE